MADSLWMVQAVIQPFRLDAVTLALDAQSAFGGMTVVECRGHGRERAKEPAPAASGARDVASASDDGSNLVDFTAKLLVEVVIEGEDQMKAVVAAIAGAAHTGRRGDGMVFVWPLALAVPVRTFDHNTHAL